MRWAECARKRAGHASTTRRIQTKIKYGAQQLVFRIDPASILENFARFGGRHRKPSSNSPRCSTGARMSRPRPELAVRFHRRRKAMFESAAIGILA